ncbi:MAG: transporter substrate-binding domain-containing protein [Alphaproteobacteria bacterium]
MKKLTQLLLLILVFLMGLLAAYMAPPVFEAAETGPVNDIKITVVNDTYESVIQKQSIRCGYAVWAPFFMKDANTGAFSGVFYDYMEALGQALKLKIDWAEEISWADFPAALKSGRIDVMCSGLWPNADRAREIDFINPIFYSPIYAYVRADDTRFDGNIDLINDPSVTIAVIDGATGTVIAMNDFPQAKTLPLPEVGGLIEIINTVVAHKADVFIIDSAFAGKYAAANPGKIKRVGPPLRVFGDTIAIAQAQGRFLRMVNTISSELLLSGKVEKILKKYEEVPGSFLRVAPSYVSPLEANSQQR